MWKDFKYSDLMHIPPPPKKLPCFLAGTLVKTANGLKNIENIQVGEMILTFNFNTNKQEYKPIIKTHTNYANQYMKIELFDGTFIEVTGGHRFWLPQQNRWIYARDLNNQDKLLSATTLLVSIRDMIIIDKKVATYNLEMQDNPNYYVTGHQILTHNKSKISAFSSLVRKEVEFYRLVKEISEDKIKTLYVGQTIQGYDKRFSQHRAAYRKNPAKRPWMKEAGWLPIKINGKLGPFKMTPFEAAVVETHELYIRGGKRIAGKGLYNRVNPVSELKFRIYKKIGFFNPCKFYV